MLKKMYGLLVDLFAAIIGLSLLGLCAFVISLIGFNCPPIWVVIILLSIIAINTCG